MISRNRGLESKISERRRRKRDHPLTVVLRRIESRANRWWNRPSSMRLGRCLAWPPTFTLATRSSSSLRFQIRHTQSPWGRNRQENGGTAGIGYRSFKTNMGNRRAGRDPDGIEKQATTRPLNSSTSKEMNLPSMNLISEQPTAVVKAEREARCDRDPDSIRTRRSKMREASRSKQRP